MKRIAMGVGIWILVFAITYTVMVLLNSIGAAAQDQNHTYGSSRIYQEISVLAHLLVNLLPAIAVGFFVPNVAWQVSAVLSFLAEVSGNLSLFGKEGLPYIGDPVAMILTYVLIAIFSAYWMRSIRAVKSTL